MDNSFNSVNPIILKFLFNATPEELITINSRTKGFSNDELEQFCNIYRSKRNSSLNLILVLCLLGLVGGCRVFSVFLLATSEWAFYTFLQPVFVLLVLS